MKMKKNFEVSLPEGIKGITPAAFADKPDGSVLEGPLVKVGVGAVLYLCLHVGEERWWRPSLFNRYYGDNWRDSIILRVIKAGDTFSVQEVPPQPQS